MALSVNNNVSIMAYGGWRGKSGESLANRYGNGINENGISGRHGAGHQKQHRESSMKSAARQRAEMRHRARYQCAHRGAK